MGAAALRRGDCWNVVRNAWLEKLQAAYRPRSVRHHLMPKRPVRPCTHPGCGTLTTGGKCSKHRTDYERQRGSASSRGYDARWRKARLEHLAEFPLCRKCGEQGIITAATDVDHIVPHRGDMVLFWDRDNWESLCHSCHSSKTMRETSRY